LSKSEIFYKALLSMLPFNKGRIGLPLLLKAHGKISPEVQDVIAR